MRPNLSAQHPLDVAIREFPSGREPWRIDGLGRIHYAGSHRSEPLISVYLTQLKEGFADPLSNLSLNGPSTEVQVKAGQIAFLKHGSVWVNKQRAGYRQQAIRDVVVTHEQVELKSFTDEIEMDGKTVPLIGHGFFVGKESWLGLRDSWLAVIRRPRPDIPYLVIPSTVIFQKCLAQSAKAVPQLLWGRLNKIVDAPSSLVDDDGAQALYVEVSKEIRSRHAYAYANLLVDPIGQREYERLRRSLVVGTVNEAANRTAASLHLHLKMGLPFSGPVAMKVRGKPLPVKKSRFDSSPEWAFLVTEIIDLSVQLPFDRLVVHRKNDGEQGLNAGDPALRDAWGVPPPVSIDFDEDEVVQVGSDDDPLTSLEAMSAEEMAGFEAVGLDVVKDPKFVQEYRRKIAAAEPGSFDGSATTGEGTGAREGPAEIDVHANQAPRVPVTLEAFFETLEILRRSGLNVETHVVAAVHRSDDLGNIVNFFPESINGVRSWHLTSDELGASPRGYVVASTRVGSAQHYFVEVERKGQEALSLAHFRQNDNSEIDARQIRAFMRDVARENGWGAARLRPNWIFQTIKHTPQGGLKRFAHFIARATGAKL